MEAVLLGTVIGGVMALVAQWIAREENRKDKANELQQARLDRHQDRLRLALSEFCAAATTFMDRGLQYAAAELATMDAQDKVVAELVKAGRADLEARDEAWEHVADDLKTRWRQATDHFMAAASAAEAQGVGAVLLLDDEPIRDDILYIGVRTWDMATSRDKLQAFFEDLRSRRTRLDDLTKKLAGKFVPAPLPKSAADDDTHS